jgi:hypothetical protein
MRLSNLYFKFFKFFFVINTFLFISLVFSYAILNIPFIPKLLGLKDFFLVLIFLFTIIDVFIFRMGKIVIDKISTKIYISILIYLLVLSFYFLLYFSLPAMIYLRKFTFFPLAYISFNLLFSGFNFQNFTNFLYSRLNRLVNFIILMIVLLGLLEYFVIPLYVWDEFLKIRDFWAMTSIDPWSMVSLEQSGRFYSWDLLILGIEKVRRLVSIFADPTIFASFLYTLMPFIVFKDKKEGKDYIVILLSLLAGALSLSKAFYLSSLIWLFFILRGKIKGYYILYLTAGIFILSFLILEFVPSEYGFIAHILGMTHSLQLLSDGIIFGLGLGRGGNYALLGEVSYDIMGGESGLGAMFSQIGIFTISFIFFIYFLLKKLSILYYKTSNYIFKSAYISLFTWYSIFLLSESSLATTGNTLIFCISGVLTGISLRNYNNFEMR